MKGTKWLILSFLIIGSILAASCQSQATPAPESEAPAAGEQLHFCVVHNNADHPSITAEVQGMDDEAKAYGNIKLTYFDPAFDPAKQASQIEDCIALKPNVIMVNAVDPAAVVSSLKKASEAGIKVIMHNADTNDDGRKYTLTMVGSDFVEQGRAVGRAMVNQLPEGSKCVLIIGKPGQTGVQERIDGANEVIAKAGKDIQFIDEQPAEWMKDKALTVMQDFLTRYPSGEINCVYALDDPMALGALEAIKAAGRQSEFKVFGVNGNKEACDAIKAGEYGGTALQLSYLMGVYTIRAGVDATQGRLLPKYIAAPTADVTPENIDEWYSQCW